MAIKERTVLNEVLLRFNPDGTLRGAHQKWETQVYDEGTGEIRFSKPGTAQPLEKETISGLMDAKVADLVGEISALKATVDAKDREIYGITAERDAAMARGDAALAELKASAELRKKEG